MLLNLNPELVGKDEPERQLALATHAGMAFYANTGRSGVFCHDCSHWSGATPAGGVGRLSLRRASSRARASHSGLLPSRGWLQPRPESIRFTKSAKPSRHE